VRVFLLCVSTQKKKTKMPKKKSCSSLFLLIVAVVQGSFTLAPERFAGHLHTAS
jgi:hypothetical protein